MSRNAFADPLLPELVRVIASHVAPRDLVSMAQVQYSWREALCEPAFVQTILAQYEDVSDTAWTADPAHWTLMLPALEAARAGLRWSLLSRKKTPLVRALVVRALPGALRPAEPDSLRFDVPYWLLVIEAIEWACRQDETDLMMDLWEEHVRGAESEVDMCTAFYLEFYRALAAFRFRVIGHLVERSDWSLLERLVLSQSTFWPRPLEVVEYLVDSAVTRQPAMVHLASVTTIAAAVRPSQGVRWARLYHDICLRVLARPSEAFLWEPLLRALPDPAEY